MKHLKGIYLGNAEITNGDDTIVLNVWMNPETKRVFGLVNMDVDATRMFANDPYDDETRIVFEDTFSGLPK
jgi:hypothetical protein